jgi:hypothetical protein
VQLGATQEKLRGLGVETLGVVNTPLERARLYFRHRPTRALVLADPDAATHRAFGVPEIGLTSGDAAAGPSHWPARVTMDELLSLRLNPTGELPEPKNPLEAMTVLNERDGFRPTEVDEHVEATHGTQLTAAFLIDRGGLVRWAFVEAQEGPADLLKFPGEEEILAAARALPG